MIFRRGFVGEIERRFGTAKLNEISGTRFVST